MWPSDEEHLNDETMFDDGVESVDTNESDDSPTEVVPDERLSEDVDSLTTVDSGDVYAAAEQANKSAEADDDVIMFDDDDPTNATEVIDENANDEPKSLLTQVSQATKEPARSDTTDADEVT